MSYESKQEINLHSAQSTPNSIAALLASADCLHPEQPVTDETEQSHLTQLAAAVVKNGFDENAYSQLFTCLEAGNLSAAALYRFANLCYHYWQHQWPTANALQTQQAEIERQTAQLQAMAQGRILFRRSGTPSRYYWGQTNVQAEGAIEKGQFYHCYPTFEAGQARQGEGIKAIYRAEAITDAANIVACEAYVQAQRHQQLTNQLFQHANVLHEKLQRGGDHAKVIVNLQLAWLYYRSGRVMHSVSMHDMGQAVFYFRQTMGEITRHHFTQQQPPLPAALTVVAEQLREAVDHALIDQAQQALFTVQSATLLARWSLCYQEPTLEAIYQLSQQTTTLLAHAVSVPLAAKQPLIDAWLAGFNRGLAGEDDQEVRVAMQSAVLSACNPVLKYPHTLATVHRWLLAMAQQLQQHDEAGRVRALLSAYQQLLIRKRPNLQQTIARTDQDKSPYIAILATAEEILTELGQWLKTANSVAETKESKESAALAIKPSAFAKRNEQIQTWHQTLAQSLAARTKTGDIYIANTQFVRNLLADICCEIEQQIGPAPCAYTLLGAGSFSRGEISPASDLDCALLVAEEAAKTHSWFRCFLQLLQWKLASLPAGVLSLESETLAWISKGFWFDTPQGFIEQHLVSQQPNNPGSYQQPENFGAQWFRWIYSSGDQPQEKDALLQGYQQRLQTFFHTPIGAGSLPAYQQLAPWSLKQHVGQAITPSRRQLSLSPKPADSSAKEAKESKHEVKASVSASSGKATFTILNVKNLSYRLINAILCYGRFYNVPSGVTTTRDVLAYLKQHQCLPASFIARLETALDQLYTWRLRQHWAWLHHASELGENEVVLWTEDPAQQAAIQALPFEQRGFYLDKAETQQCQIILNTVAEVIGRSVEGFTLLEALAPFVGTRHAVPVQDDPISPSSSYTTTTVSDSKKAKESKREVSEAEAQAILVTQARVVAETKSSAPSSAIQAFNPLAAAVEWTLQQLAKPKDRNATEAQHASRTYSPDPGLTWIPRTSRGTSGNETLAVEAAEIQTGSVEQAHVQWLAQVMGTCTEELPVNEPHSNDPVRVKQDAEFCKHWQVYWAIPTAWRDMYIKQLRQRLTIKPDIIEPLVNAPNKVGWRLSTQIGEQQWQQALRPLFAAEPQNSLLPEAKTDIAQGKAIWVSWLEEGSVRWAPLRQECVKVLVDAKQQRWQPQHNVHGNHRLYALQTPSHSFWVKAYPEQPGTEYLVTALDRRLDVNGTPAQQLMALHHAPLRVPDGTPQGMQIQQSAILLSQHVADAKYTLHRQIKKEPQFLEKLDFLAFAKTLLRVLLTNPEDDKGSDYFLVPIAGSDKYQLIRIDNERAFLPVTHLTSSTWSSQEDLQVKSILYCLDQMLLPWSSDPRTAELLDDLHQIQPSALIIDLLQDIEQQHTHWQQLFSKASIAQHASLQDPWMSIPTFMLPQGLESALLKRLTSLQTALRLLKPQAITGLKLLELVQPKLARYYNQSLFQGKLARDPKSPQANVQARFDHVAGRFYQQQQPVKSATTASSQDHQTSVASGPAVVSRQLSIALPELPKNPQEKEALISFVRSIWLKQAHSVQQALAAVATWQHLEAQRVMKGLLALRKESQIEFGLLAAREQQQLLDQLLSKETKPTTPLTSQQQQYLLTALVGAQCHNLDLRPFAAVLTEALLLPILVESGQQLIRLDISGCTLLPSSIVGSIAKHAKHLKHLLANDQSCWASLSLGDFEALTRFECNNATTLTSMTLGHLPALKHLSLQQAGQLTVLADQGFGITSSSVAWHLPALQRLNIRDCQQLRTVQLWVEHPEQLSMQTAGCDQLQLPQLQSPQHATPTANYLTDLATQKQLSAFLEEPFRRQWFLTHLPRLMQLSKKGAEKLLDFEFALYQKVGQLSPTIKASLGSADEGQLVQALKRITMLLAMGLFAHGRTDFTFIPNTTMQQSYAVWESILLLLKVEATKTAAYAHHLPSLLSLRDNGDIYQFKEAADYDFWLVSALLEIAQADKLFQTAVLHFFNQRPIQDAPGAVNLLAEMVPSSGNPPAAGYATLRRLLFDTIACSARERAWAQASSNAATLLNACREPLSDQRWAGVQLAGADLRYSMLAHSDLRGANLCNAHLRRSVLYQSNLTSADLRDVNLDDFPDRLKLKEKAYAIAWHPTQPIIAVAQGNIILQFNCDTGEPLSKPLAGHTWDITSVAYRPDGRRLVSGSSDKTLRQWDAETGAPLGAPLTGHTGWVYSVAYRPDGRRLVSGSGDHTLRQWDAETGQALGAPLTGHVSSVTSVVYRPDGRRLVSGSWDNTVRQWDAETGAQIGLALTGHTGYVLSVAYCPDGRGLVSGSSDNTVRQWDAETGAQIGAPLTGHTGNVTSVAYRPDGRRLVSSSSDNTVRQWDAETGAPLGAPLTGHTGDVTSVAYRPDGKRIVSGSSDRTLRQWDADAGQLLGPPLTGHTGDVTSVAYRPDGKRIVSGSSDRTLRQWDTDAGQLLGPPLTGHTNTVTSVAYHPDGKRIVSGSWDRTLRQWDADAGQSLGPPLTGHAGSVNSVAWCPDGKRIVSGSSDRTLRQWNADAGQLLGLPLIGHTNTVTSVAWCSDGKRIVSGSLDNTLRQWDADRSLSVLLTFGVLPTLGVPLKRHTGPVHSVAYHPDGKGIVSGSSDRTLRQWNADIGQPFGPPLTGHTDEVYSVAYRPDGRWIASGGRDNTVRLWDAENQRCLAVLRWHQAVNSVAFCPLNAKPTPTSADSKAVATRNAATKTAEYQLAIGDAAGTISIWAISAEHPEAGFRLVHLSKQVAMPLTVHGALLKDCRMSALSKRLLAQHGGKVEEVIVDDSDTLADSKSTQPLATSQTTTSPTSNAAFFQPAPRSGPVETKETKQERKGTPKDPQTQARLNAVLELMDKVYPVDDPDHANKRTHYLGQLTTFQQRAELTSEELSALETIEKELQAEQMASAPSL